MRKVRKTLSIVVAASAILVMLAVAGHAKKPAPPAEPTIQVLGGIMVLPEGTTTDATNVRVRFADDSFGRFDWLAGKSFPANADRSPALHAINQYTGTEDRRLKFYFCADPSHQGETGEDDLRCQDPERHSAHYYALNLHDGQTTVKGRGGLDHLIFPPGTLWTISSKVDNSTVAQSNLVTETTYDVIQ
jgi:hypothetical protein